MNQNTKQLLEEVGYNYPEYAALAQKLVAVLAKRMATYAAANNELKTSQEITAKFLTADPILTAAATPAVAATVTATATPPVSTP